jgi:hypothetical protein
MVRRGGIMSSSVIGDKSESKIVLLNDEQAIEFFDKQVRALLGISGSEFLSRLDKGEYKDACDNPKVLKLLMMIPKSKAHRDHK